MPFSIVKAFVSSSCGRVSAVGGVSAFYASRFNERGKTDRVGKDNGGISWPKPGGECERFTSYKARCFSRHHRFASECRNSGEFR